jgi:bifunctional NMN adenylyltransferase/nudix hydrolase
VYPTVDIALFRNKGTELLLGKKQGAKGWRLPGGFCDPTDESFEAAAKRELMEECGNLEITPMQYAGSCRINDWRYRQEEDKIITTLFRTELLFGVPEAHDDLEELKWFEVGELKENEYSAIIAEHRDLLKMLFKNSYQPSLVS